MKRIKDATQQLEDGKQDGGQELMKNIDHLTAGSDEKKEGGCMYQWLKGTSVGTVSSIKQLIVSVVTGGSAGTTGVAC